MTVPLWPYLYQFGSLTWNLDRQNKKTQNIVAGPFTTVYKKISLLSDTYTEQTAAIFILAFPSKEKFFSDTCT